MKTRKPTPAIIIACYFPLLYRYARAIIQDEAMAKKLVQQVLIDQYDIDRLMPSSHLRQLLKTDLFNRCSFYKLSLIFSRPPIMLPRYDLTKEKKHIPKSLFL